MTTRATEKDQAVNFMPDLLIIPAAIAFSPILQPLDKMVYGVIYWMERLKDGRCWASNATLAKITGSSSSGVSHALARLMEDNFIDCIYDASKNQRTEIRTLVFNSVNPISNELGGVAQMSYIKNNIKHSNYTSETLQKIERVYNTWLIKMVITARERDEITSDSDKIALLAAAKKKYRLTDKRKRKVGARLEDAGLRKILRAIHAISMSDFHRGENDRGWTADLDWLCKSYEKIEEWSNKYNRGQEAS